MVDALEALERLLRDFAVPLAKISGERLLEFGHWDCGWKNTPPVVSLVPVLDNWEEVLALVVRPGQRFKGEGGTEAAGICIQSCWRGYLAQTTHLRLCWRRCATGTIAIAWLMHTQRPCRPAISDSWRITAPR